MAATDGARARTGTVIAIAVAGLGLLATLAVWILGSGQHASQTVGRPATTMADFVLIDQDGKSFDSRSLRGKAALVFFGFTHCPDVCPTTLAAMSAVLEQLGEAAAEVQPVFISIDPQRDRPESLKAFRDLFDSRIIMLTGSKAEIAAVAKAWHVYFAPQKPDSSGNYNVDHTASVFLIDRNGIFRSTFDFHEAEEVIVEKVKLLIAR